jgi:hypothetical protein
MQLLSLALGAAAALNAMAGPPQAPAAGPGPAAGLQAHALHYAPGPLDNPLKGLAAYMPDNGEDKRRYPSSLNWGYLPLKALMLDWDKFDWAPLEKILNQSTAEGRQIALRVYVEYPEQPSGIPDFLRKSGIAIRHTKQWNTESPDYDDPRTLKALSNFIHAWGAKYDGDPRIAFITLGLVGLWGEWHLWPSQELFPKDPAVIQVIDAYDESFKKTKLLIRYPHLGNGEAARKNIGFHDDSFAFKDNDENGLKSGTMPASEGGHDWSFLQHMLDVNAENRWTEEVIGGELRPDIQTTLFTDKSHVDDLKACVGLSHVTWLLDHKGIEGFEAGNKGMDAFVRSMGYDLWIPKAYFKPSLKAGQGFKVAVDLANDGVAPFYYPWAVVLALRDSQGKVLKSWDTDWDLRKVQPRKIRPYKDWKLKGGSKAIDFTKAMTFEKDLDDPGLAPGTYSLALRVINPMENLCKLARPLRFSNTSQEASGWLDLGKIKISSSKP